MRLDEIVAAEDVLRREKITRPERECTVLEVASFNPLETLTPDTPNGKSDGIVFIERHRLVSGFDDNVDVAGQRLGRPANVEVAWIQYFFRHGTPPLV